MFNRIAVISITSPMDKKLASATRMVMGGCCNNLRPLPEQNNMSTSDAGISSIGEH